MIWKILGIEETKDEEKIKEAYRNRLHSVNPEDDEEGFKELRRAYEEAVAYANRPETEDEEEDAIDDSRKNDVDRWIDRIDLIYRDTASRIDEDRWKELLADPVCDDLDTELEAAEKLLVYFMSHSFMPQNIWQMVEKRFHYLDSFDQLKERFPENYLDYVKWQIENPGFIDYRLFDGKTDDHVDDFISKLFELKSASDDKDLEQLEKLFREIERFEITHPFTQVEKARYHLAKKEPKEALDIMEELDFEYSDNAYIERIYAEALIANGKVDSAEKIYDAFLERMPDDYIGLLGRANCIFLKGNPEEAKEQIEDILEDRVQDTDSLELLDTINEVLVDKYEAQLKENFDRDICFKLGWCYYQQKKFDEGIRLLDKLEQGEDYDYVNLRCRLYLANEDYDKAYPLALKWLQIIEESPDDGTREMTKRKQRLSLALFSVGVCVWETAASLTEDEKGEKQHSAAKYIKEALEKEDNLLVKLSYMEQLARFYLDAGNYEKCIDICTEIIEKDRGFFPAYVHRQRANYKLKNAREVIDDYFACQELYAAYAPPYHLAAEVFFAFDQYEDLEKVLEAAKEAGLESHTLELYRIQDIHYKEFSRENVKTALQAMIALRKKIKELPEGEETDIEDLANLEREHAVLYWDLDETDKALAIVEEYLQGHKDDLTLTHLKADILLREERYEEALRVCRQLAEVLEPDNLYAELKLGNCYERMGNYRDAIKHYNAILGKNESFQPALRRMMYLYSFLSNRENDLKKCHQGIAYATRFIEAGGGAEGYVERGNLYIDVYELEKAVADCRKAIELDEDAYYAYNNLGCALLKLRRVEEAVPPLKHAIEMDPEKDHLPYLNLAECYLLSGEYDKAIDAYGGALKIHPGVFKWQEEIASLYVKKGEYDKAISIYRKRMDELENPGDVKRFLAKCLGTFLSDEKKEEIRRYEAELLKIYKKLGNIYRKAGNTEKAEYYFNLICRRWKNPSVDRYAFSELEEAGEYFREKGDFKTAAQILSEGLRVNRTNSLERNHLHFTCATVYFEEKKKEEAALEAKLFLKGIFDCYGGEDKYLADARYLPARLYNIAIMYICMGDLDKAGKYLKRIASCNLCVMCENAGCFEYYFGQGLIAELKGDKEQAGQLYRKALEIEKDYPCCARHLKNL